MRLVRFTLWREFVRPGPVVYVNPERVACVEALEGTWFGGDGNPLAVPIAKIHMSGTSVTVDCPAEEVVERLRPPLRGQHPSPWFMEKFREGIAALQRWPPHVRKLYPW